MQMILMFVGVFVGHYWYIRGLPQSTNLATAVSPGGVVGRWTYPGVFVIEFLFKRVNGTGNTGELSLVCWPILYQVEYKFGLALFICHWFDFHLSLII
jgi:hypothetical protein